jgi:hypothetical protein
MSLSFWNKSRTAGDDQPHDAEDGIPADGDVNVKNNDESNPSLNAANICNILGYIFNTIFTYGVGNAGFFGRPTNGDLSRKYQTIITPKSSAFIIWSIIFTFQAIFVVLQALPRYRGRPIVQQGVGYWYFIVCLLQVAWTFAFSYEVIPLSLVCMILLWVGLMAIVYCQYYTESENNGCIGGQIEFWLFRFPFSVHGGWITAASALNVSVVAVDEKLSGSAQLTIAILSLAVLHAISVWHVFGYTRPNYVIPIVLAWANYWIYAELKDPEQLILDTFNDVVIEGVRSAALGVSLIILGQVAVRLIFFSIAYCRGVSYVQKK